MNKAFIESFGTLEDPRIERTKKHALLDVIAIAIIGVMAGAQSFKEMEDFGLTHEKWLKQYLQLENGIPSHDTINRVCQSLKPESFQKAFLKWVHAFYVCQFSSRLLSDAMLLRGILFVAGIIHLFKDKLTAQHLMVGGFLLALSGGFWMYNNYYASPEQLPALAKDVQNDSFHNYTEDYYIVVPEVIKTQPEYSLANNKNLLNVFEVQKNCKQEKLTSRCAIQVGPKGQFLQLPILYYPELLNIKVNGQAVQYYPSEIKTNTRSKDYLVAAIYLPQGKYVVQSQYVGVVWANRVSILAFMVMGMCRKVKF